MLRKTPSNDSDNLQSMNDGMDFEARTRFLLNLIPGAEVSDETRVRGKKVDCICRLPQTLSAPLCIAVECKDHAKALNRKQCGEILSDYRSLLDGGDVDQFLLITSSGVLPNAKELFNGKDIQHLTYAQLADKIFNPAPLVESMFRQYKHDKLDEFYIKPRAFAPDPQFVNVNYLLLYSDFMNLAAELDFPNFYKIVQEFDKYYPAAGDNTRSTWNGELYSKCVAARKPRARDLESYIIDWLSDPDLNYGLALLGSYGTGKSSFSRRIAHVCAQQYKKNRLSRIPLLIELKEFGSHQDIRGLITHELVNRHRIANGSFDLFQSLNSSGRFFIILDGFDEMKQGLTHDTLVYNFHQINTLFTPATKILLCGRPTLFENQEEQNRVMQGRIGVSNADTVRYVPIEISAFEIDEVLEFLPNFTKIKVPENLRLIKKFSQELSDEINIRGNSELLSIVSRPVHLPMLVSVIPRKPTSAREIRRSTLYSEFIDAIIEREMLKRRSDFPQIYAASERRIFARELAAEMWKRGQHRAVTSAEIPHHLLERFVQSGRPIEAVRRDLVSACFLERKNPDILFIPHKSFLEFLVAEFISVSLRDKADAEIISGIEMTDEIFSFLRELLQDQEWARLASHPSRNSNILRIWIRYLQMPSSQIPCVVEEALLEKFKEVPGKVREELAYYYSSRRAEHFTASSADILVACLRDESYLVGVHAYRALSSALPTEHSWMSEVGEERLFEWALRGWIKLPAGGSRRLEEIAIQRLANTLALRPTIARPAADI